MKRGIRTNVRQRVAANRQRLEEAREREERDREALRLLNQKERKQDETTKTV
jgi:hypothetical protein